MDVCAQATPLIAFLSGTEFGATPRQLRTCSARLVASRLGGRWWTSVSIATC